MRDRTVFVDKDGTLVVDVPFNVDPGLIRLAPGSRKGLELLRDAGCRFFVFSNQPGVARGYFSESELGPVEERIRELLLDMGIRLEGFYYCPHHPDGVVEGYSFECRCRKPAPGMLLRAAAEHGIDLASSWLLGDLLHDVEAGRRAGMTTVLVDNGNETEWVMTAERMPHYVVRRIDDAARIILAVERWRSHERAPRGREGRWAV